ncbi:winged helix-turn-helix domain-containing protein [Pseudobacteriovorax antillogorgiicola]|uniref:DNA-binding response regulator, OmpR family, contains REC and winged-helix (WHTH) domain n=1 Tax=Pseudobacteriovorax antillogorgiicola TaxID=1513793 RepID=A0A1Y6B3H8_9BACT|nr:winged helix-turn-helix domain-containing protein [Pseudobacteriovorax antillogorgiicola]TCS59302.1 DNA-binding response OmpR family regulator [Pseudobacteriovorax antillogorgiicola]SME89596.1 DNA-binding response regulator, OmpR family, contains REC and winged-helix (wHTH) domain [Pseudobacteriovorax antillogorgiicola]
MGVVWLLERPDGSRKRILPLIQGAVAVRSIASLDSLITLARIAGSIEKPQALIVNGLDFDSLDALKDRSLRGVRILIVADNLCDLDDEVLHFDETLPFRIKAALERQGASAEPFTLDFESMRLVIHDNEVEIALSHKEAKIIKLLLSSHHKPISRRRLAELVWDGAKISRSTIDSHMSRLRKKLGNTCLEIESVYGGGYRLVELD